MQDKETKQNSSRPNILLLTSDQQHWSTLGVINEKIKTPNLDRLCKEGVRFTRAYTNHPLCTPSRASIITGMYPSSHGAWCIGVHLPEDVPTVGQAFQNEGYSTTLIGKAHFQPQKDSPGHPSIESGEKVKDLDFWRNFHGPWYGFEHVETMRNHADGWLTGSHYGVWLEDVKGVPDWRKYTDNPVDSGVPNKPDWYWEGPNRRRHSWEIPEELHYGSWLAESTMANIDRCCEEGRPFFMWTSFPDPHPPYLVPEPWASMYDPEAMELDDFDATDFNSMPPHYGMTQDAGADWSVYEENGLGIHGAHNHLHDPDELKKDLAVYYGMISKMDHDIGKILNHLDAKGLTENTLVVFSSDHGHYIGQHGLVSKGPFHFEDGLRVPFIVRHPKRLPAGSVNDSLQCLLDLPETFLAAAGIDIPGEMQGVNQYPVWMGNQESARDYVIIENRNQPTKFNSRTFVTKRYKLTMYMNQPYGELFDLEDDPCERRNQWDNAEYAAVKHRLMQKWLNAEMRREPTRMPRVSEA